MLLLAKSIKLVEDTIKTKLHSKIKDKKVPNEANLVACFWKKPDLYATYKIDDKHFTENDWRVFFIIGRDVYATGKEKITDIEVALYLNQHPKMKEVYDNAGGYDTIQQLYEYIDISNFEGYMAEFEKWWVVEEMNKRGWVSEAELKKFIDHPVDYIYKYYTAHINDIFIHADGDVKSHNLCSNLEQLIEDADKGLIKGIPLYNAPLVNNMIGGVRKGEITMLAGGSGAGKTTTMLQWLIPTMIYENKKIVLMLNEQDENKVRREVMTWIINNVLKKRFKKERWVQGNFTDEEKEMLHEAKEWLQDKEDKRNVTIIPLEKYNVDTVIKLINKYSAMGVEYFVLDTFKASTSSNDAIWLEMQQDAVRLYDTIKPVANNVALWINLQLTKEVFKLRYLTMYNIGMAKNVVDVASTVILMRSILNNEKDDGKSPLEIIKYYKGTHSKHKTKVKSDDMSNHSIFFIPKTRENGGDYQIVSKNDFGTNTFEEVGICHIAEDF